MPHDTSYVEPELFLFHNDIAVYHMYKNDDVNNGPYSYWFTTDDQDGSTEFDVRDLPGWDKDKSTLANRREVLAAAIDAGIIIKFISKE